MVSESVEKRVELIIIMSILFWNIWREVGSGRIWWGVWGPRRGHGESWCHRDDGREGLCGHVQQPIGPSAGIHGWEDQDLGQPGIGHAISQLVWAGILKLVPKTPRAKGGPALSSQSKRRRRRDALSGRAHSLLWTVPVARVLSYHELLYRAGRKIYDYPTLTICCLWKLVFYGRNTMNGPGSYDKER